MAGEPVCDEELNSRYQQAAADEHGGPLERTLFLEKMVEDDWFEVRRRLMMRDKRKFYTTRTHTTETWQQPDAYG